MDQSITGKYLLSETRYANTLDVGMVFELPDRPYITAVVVEIDADVYGADVKYMTLYTPVLLGFCGMIRFGDTDTVVTHRVIE